MFKVSVVSTIVLLLASGAWAAIGHTQGFNIGGTNYAGLVGGGLVQSGNYGATNQMQTTTNTTGSLFLKQNQGGELTQEATVQGGNNYCGCSGENNIWQGADTGGFQGQYANKSCFGSIGTATQGLGAGLGTEVWTHGSGNTQGYQNFNGNQVQYTNTPSGVGLQFQDVDATQYVNVETAPHSYAEVSSTLDVNAGQSQTVYGR